MFTPPDPSNFYAQHSANHEAELMQIARDEQEYKEWEQRAAKNLQDTVETIETLQPLLQILERDESTQTQQLNALSDSRNKISRRRILIENMIQRLQIQEQKHRLELGINGK